MTVPRLPRVARAAFRLLPVEDRDQVSADIAELYRERRAASGALRAGLWLAINTVRLVRDLRRDARREAPPTGGSMTTVWLDFRDAARHLVSARGFTAMVTLTLALGIGASVGVFAIVDAALFAPLPYRDADRVVRIGEQSGTRTVSVSYPNFLDWQTRARAFDAMAAHQIDTGTLMLPDGAVAVRSLRVTAGYFRVLGLPALVGRPLGDADSAPGAPRTAVLSHAFWISRFGGDAAVLDRTLTIDGEPFSVVGVMPAALEPGRAPDVWVALEPFVAGSGLANRGSRAGTGVMARLADGVTEDAARIEMLDIARQLAAEHPGPNGTVLTTLQSVRDAETGAARPGLLAIVAAVGALLLIGCLNAASLQTARLAARGREFAVRAALGASRGRLARQLLFEGLLVAALAGLAGVALAEWLVRSVVSLDPGGIPRLADAAINARIVGVAVLLTTVVGLVFSLVPMLQARPGSLASTIQQGGRSATSSRRWLRLRAGLVLAQVALSLTLLTGSALMIRSLARLDAVDVGFDPTAVLSVTLQLTTPGTPAEGRLQTIRFYQDLTERVTALPGVTSAAVATPMPLTGANRQNRYWIEGQTFTTLSELPRVDTAAVGTRYFETMQIPVKRGRVFEGTESGRPSVAVVDETFANRYWPGLDPIGRDVQMGAPGTGGPQMRVIGVVGAVRHYDVSQPPVPQIYLSQNQWPLGGWFLVRTAGDPAAMAPAVRQAVADLAPDVPVINSYPASDLVRHSTASRTFSAFVLTLFATLAVGLAGLGLYGLMAYDVEQRRREIGVRLALGATSAMMRRLVLRRAMAIVAAGCLIGLGGAWLIGRALETQVFGVAPTDPASYVSACAAMIAAGLAGSLLPGLRASRVAPADSLKS